VIFIVSVLLCVVTPWNWWWVSHRQNYLWNVLSRTGCYFYWKPACWHNALSTGDDSISALPSGDCRLHLLSL